MKRFLYLLRQYYADSASDYVKFYKPGKVRKFVFWLFSSILIILFIWLFIDGFTKNVYFEKSNIYGTIKIAITIILGLFLLYFGLLSTHIIVTDDYVEYVEYLVKRRKIKLSDIKSCEHMVKNGIAPTLRIHSKNSDDPIIDINYSMFNSQNELNEFIGLLGITENKKSVTKNNNKQTKTQKHKKKKLKFGVYFWMSKIISVALFIDVFFILYFFVIKMGLLKSRNKSFDRKIRLLGIIVVILGFKFSTYIENKIRSKSVKLVVTLGLISVLSIPLIFWVLMKLL